MTINPQKSKRVSSVCALLIFSGVIAIQAGGALETVDITGLTPSPSPFPGEVLARVIGIKWDVRSIPVKYSINTTLDPVPNPLGAAFLTLAEARTEFQASFDAWNNVRTSFIDMRITGTTANPGLRGFDMVNEITFRTAGNFTAIASSPSVSLIEDTTLVDGDQLDNDADSDVSSAITVATDVDGDGDIEFPAGFYKAGTILDNDIQFNTKTTSGFRFTVDPAAADIVTRSVDLFGVAVHEFGHSLGLSHSLNNQNSASDGNGATMFPFIDTGDPAAELAQRTLDIDDIAYASLYYREGTAASGPAALQAGDLAFSKAFGLIKGDLQHGVLDQPVAGGHVFTQDSKTGTAGPGGFSGTTQLSFDPVSGGLFFLDEPADGVVNGDYVIPVPKGKYDVLIEPVDGTPVPAASVSFTTQIGTFYGQQNFNEEVGVSPGHGHHGPSATDNVSVNAGKTENNVDIVTSDDINVDNFGSRDFTGFTGALPGRLYAVRIPASQITAKAAGRDVEIKALAFHTGSVDASIAPVFAEAMLTTGTENADGSLASINLKWPLVRQKMMLGQDDDLTPLVVGHGELLGWLMQLGIKHGLVKNLYLVLRVPSTTPFPGVSARPPLIGLDGGVAVNDGPIFGLSYFSDDGGLTYTLRTDFNFRFSLRLAERRFGHHD